MAWRAVPIGGNRRPRSYFGFITKVANLGVNVALGAQSLLILTHLGPSKAGHVGEGELHYNLVEIPPLGITKISHARKQTSLMLVGV